MSMVGWSQKSVIAWGERHLDFWMGPLAECISWWSTGSRHERAYEKFGVTNKNSHHWTLVVSPEDSYKKNEKQLLDKLFSNISTKHCICKMLDASIKSGLSFLGVTWPEAQSFNKLCSPICQRVKKHFQVLMWLWVQISQNYFRHLT